MLTAFRLLHATNFMYPAGQGSGGMESLRWLIPVRPGDTIRMECEVTDARVLTSKPHMGVCSFHYHVFNQRDERVMDWKASAFYLRRPENRSGFLVPFDAKEGADLAQELPGVTEDIV